MIRRYKVTTNNYRQRTPWPITKTILAYDAKDAYNQVDLLIDKTIQCDDTRVISVEPYPFTVKERLKMLFK